MHDEPLFHHCIPFNNIVYGTLKPDRQFASPDFLPAYEWCEREVGFYPLFLSAGRGDDAIRMTGYGDNWKVWTGSSTINGRRVEAYRKKGEFPNLVVFSFQDIRGIFMDYDWWHLALTAGMAGRTVTGREKRMIFKPSWSRSRWLKAAKDGTREVQLVAPSLPLDRAERVYVRNGQTRRQLREMGFPDPVVKRISCRPFSR